MVLRDGLSPYDGEKRGTTMTSLYLVGPGRLNLAAKGWVVDSLAAAAAVRDYTTSFGVDAPVEVFAFTDERVAGSFLSYESSLPHPLAVAHRPDLMPVPDEALVAARVQDEYVRCFSKLCGGGVRVTIPGPTIMYEHLADTRSCGPNWSLLYESKPASVEAWTSKVGRHECPYPGNCASCGGFMED